MKVVILFLSLVGTVFVLAYLAPSAFTSGFSVWGHNVPFAALGLVFVGFTVYKMKSR